jgi:hypothetical protein
MKEVGSISRKPALWGIRKAHRKYLRVTQAAGLCKNGHEHNIQEAYESEDVRKKRYSEDPPTPAPPVPDENAPTRVLSKLFK